MPLSQGPVNLRGLGLTEREPLEAYVRNEDNDLPFLQYNNRTELLELREMLKVPSLFLCVPLYFSRVVTSPSHLSPLCAQDVGMCLEELPDEDDGGDDSEWRRQ